VGIIKLAEALVEDSFKKYGKLVLRSPMPDTYEVLSRTPASDIKTLFAILDIEDFLEIREVLTERQKAAGAKHDKTVQKKR
jgi:hypothetical protein